MRWEILECGQYQAATFKSKFGGNQHDKVLRKQQSLGLILQNYF